MALGTCGRISACLCCLLCSGFLCFLIFGGAVTAAFYAIFNAKCEGTDLEAAKVCMPLTWKLGNATLKYEPRFERSQELERLVKLCRDAATCIKTSPCISHRYNFYKLEKNHCDVFTFIQNEFGSCAEKLKRKAQKEGVPCLKVLFRSEKCKLWKENQACIAKEIKEECGVKMAERFGQVAAEFSSRACGN